MRAGLPDITELEIYEASEREWTAPEHHVRTRGRLAVNNQQRKKEMLSKTVVFLVGMVALAGTAHAQVVRTSSPDQLTKQSAKKVDTSAIAARLRSASTSAIKIVSPFEDWSLSTDSLSTIASDADNQTRVSTLASVDRSLSVINSQLHPIMPPEMAVGLTVPGNLVKHPIGSEATALAPHASPSRFASLRVGLLTNSVPIAMAPIFALNLPAETNAEELTPNGVNGLHGVKSTQRAMSMHTH